MISQRLQKNSKSCNTGWERLRGIGEDFNWAGWWIFQRPEIVDNLCGHFFELATRPDL